MKRKIIKIFASLLLVACAALGLAGCVFNGNVIGLSNYHYDDSENYTVGEAEITQTVENIEIDWLVGKLNVLTHNSSAVSFSENSEKELTEKTKVRYWLDNTTLRIRFCACGKLDLSEMKKELTVSVPETLILKNMKVNGVSADIKLSDCAVTQTVKVNTVSGNTEAKFTQPLHEFEGNSTSGEFTLIAPSISRFDVDTVSGEVSLSANKEPDWLDADTTSGNICLILPESASFALNYDTTSGGLYSLLTYRWSAGKYIFGDGQGDYEISTVSGNVRITPNAQENSR